ncbi:hypothetical protein PF70_00683 [Pseudomonas asplenii]|nr:hypothetical protein PF70_00683 [Pseudomonas fuscovaginae]
MPLDLACSPPRKKILPVSLDQGERSFYIELMNPPMTDRVLNPFTAGSSRRVFLAVDDQHCGRSLGIQMIPIRKFAKVRRQKRLNYTLGLTGH